MRALGVGLMCAAMALGTARAGTEADAWSRLLAAAGLSRETCRFDLLDMAQYGGGAHRLPFFDAVHQDPLRIPFYSRVTRQAIAATGGKVGPLATLAALRAGDGTRLDLLGDPLAREAEAAAKPDALIEAARAVYAATGTPMPTDVAQRIRLGQNAVPADVRAAAAFALRVAVRASEWRKRALAAAPPEAIRRLWKEVLAYPTDDDGVEPATEALLATVDRKRLMVGAELLAFAVDGLKARLAARSGAERFMLDFATPMGAVRLRGAQDDRYEGPALLVVDTGGNDVYRAGAATAQSGPGISIIADVRGDDRYVSEASLDAAALADLPSRKALSRAPAFGGGVLGYGVVVDMAGNDLYRAPANCMGSATFGAGILADFGGSDTYDCHTAGQGAATGGIGILLDAGGADRYLCFTTSQGFGGTAGCGILADLGADGDTYVANDTVLDFPSPQSAQHNANLAQGAGYGRRADYTDGHSLAGGVGILSDAGGDNAFTCGIFGQGVGYWYGVGVLLTGGGSDTLTGQWYVQGASAHFAVGILDDEGGSDTYTAAMNMAQGAGHDFSVGFLHDRGGNDRYMAPNLSLGGGNANGLGFFWDRAGNDTYVVRPSVTLGRTGEQGGGIRERNLTLGLFLDTGGADTYPPEIADARNGAVWTTGSAATAARGAGCDTEAPDIAEPR